MLHQYFLIPSARFFTNNLRIKNKYHSVIVTIASLTVGFIGIVICPTIIDHIALQLIRNAVVGRLTLKLITTGPLLYLSPNCTESVPSDGFVGRNETVNTCQSHRKCKQDGATPETHLSRMEFVSERYCHFSPVALFPHNSIGGFNILIHSLRTAAPHPRPESTIEFALGRLCSYCNCNQIEILAYGFPLDAEPFEIEQDFILGPDAYVPIARFRGRALARTIVFRWVVRTRNNAGV